MVSDRVSGVSEFDLVLAQHGLHASGFTDVSLEVRPAQKPRAIANLGCRAWI